MSNYMFGIFNMAMENRLDTWKGGKYSKLL